MKSRLFSYSSITLLIGGLFAQCFTGETASANWENSFLWDAPVQVSRPATPKTGRKPRQKHVPPVEVVPLLTLKYQVLTRGDGGTAQKVDAAKTDFKVGDQLKLAVTPNQNGFLYVVHHSIDNNNKVIDQPHVIFPNPGVNDGRNAVKKDEQYLVPKYCPQFTEDPTDCWWEITPPNGKDFFTVIFSRDEIADLPSKLTNEDSSNDKDAIAMNIIAQIKNSSNTKDIARSDKVKISSRSTTESDGTYIQNTNKSDNEELFDTIELRHQVDTGNNPVALTRALFVKKRADAMHVSFLKGGREIDPGQVFKAGDEIEVKYESNFNGYIYLVNITPKNQRFLIFPCIRPPGFNITVDKGTTQTVGFDDEKGTEVLQVILARERIDFLENAIKSDCCADPTKCELSASAASAAAELASNAAKQQKGGIAVNDVLAVVPENRSSGIRARGITLAQGKKGGSYVAIENSSSSQDDSKLKAGRYVVFEIRLNHN